MKKFTGLFLLCIALNGHSENVDLPTSGIAVGEVAGHEYVDLGLPSGTLWATCNLGAESQYVPGEYFAWGETEARDIFKWYDYQFFNEEYTDAEGSLNYSATDIGKEISGSEYDAARIQWGDGWRTPTQEEWEELIACCHAEYKTESVLPPKAALHIWGPNGNRIRLAQTFSPHNGFYPAVSTGEYWSATSCSDPSEDRYPSAMMMTFNPADSKLKLQANGRHDGLSIRPVISPKDVATSVGTLAESERYIKYENGVISISGYDEGLQLAVADLSGRQVYASKADSNICHLPALTKGIYIVTLSHNNKTMSAIKITVK